MKRVRPLRTEVRCRVLDVVSSRLEEAQVVVLGGPRAVGKSTVLRTLARNLDREVIDLDDPATARAVKADPGRFLDRPRPVLVRVAGDGGDRRAADHFRPLAGG